MGSTKPDIYRATVPLELHHQPRRSKRRRTKERTSPGKGEQVKGHHPLLARKRDLGIKGILTAFTSNKRGEDTDEILLIVPISCEK
jgi:hypothetical protein